MKIAIDARWIFDEISGIGNYTLNMIRNLAEIDKENTYLLVFDDEARKNKVIKKAGLDDNKRFESRIISYGVFSIRNQILFSYFLKKNNVDLFHSTNYMIPLFMKICPVVVTIHDIIPLKHPEFTPKAKKTKMFGLYKWIMARVVKISESIVTDSENSRNDIIEYFSCPPNKVKTVYPGIDKDFTTQKEDTNEKDFKKSYRIKGKLVIYVGRQDPYKNILGLAKAFRRMLAEEKLEAKLLIVGPEDERYSDVHRYKKQYNLNDRIIFSGYLSDSDLISLYRQADLLVLPSRYEGFGLPVLEAFSAGTPVVAADTSSLPEVVGDAGILVDPENTVELKNAIKHVLFDEDFSKSLVEKGFEKLKEFSWEGAAEEILEIYKQAVVTDSSRDSQKI